MARCLLPALRRWAPEFSLALLTASIFLAHLGSVDLWGKREQRAAAEALDTLQNNNWLIAYIQSRPRLEKPPLPRWTIASLMALTGRSDESMVRLPSAFSGMLCVGLVYGLGRRLGGRSVGLASGLALCSTGYFISESRQAGNDAPLALFTTLALYAAWRRLHGHPVDSPPGSPTDQPGHRAWGLLLHAALGLGFLTKGPIVLVLVGLTLVPYLGLARRLRPGLRLLADPLGLLLLLGLALSWPLPVALLKPQSLGVWYLEIFQKAGSAGIEQHKPRAPLAAEWLWMSLPWTPVALLASFLPLLKGKAESYRPGLWFPWFWTFGNLFMFSFWTVSKPNYYVPCLPGLALLVGLQWVRIIQLSREGSAAALRLIQTYWVLPFSAACAAPILTFKLAPQFSGPTLVIAAAYLLAVFTSALFWRRGATGPTTMAPLVAALGITVSVVYGWIGPALIGPQSHRSLARQLSRLIPPDVHTLMFFDELDEGLWFYLRNHQLQRVPGSGPELNHAYDLMVDARRQRLLRDPNQRILREQQVLLDWLHQEDRPSPYVLIRQKLFDRFAPALEGQVDVILREPPLQRNELVLLQARNASPTLASDPRAASTHR